MTSFMPKMPVPDLPPNWWEKLLSWGKKFLEWLFPEESKNLGGKAPVGKDSTIDDISQISNLLTQTRQKIEVAAKEVDKQLQELILDFAEDIRFAADLGHPVFQEYPVNFRYFDRLLNSVPRQMEHAVGNTVSRMVSLDSPDFYEAMRMMPGERKEQRISELLHQAMETSLNTAVETAEELFREVVEEYSDALSDAIGRAELTSEMVLVQLGQLTSAAEDKDTVAERVAANAESIRQAALVVNSVLDLKEV